MMKLAAVYAAPIKLAFRSIAPYNTAYEYRMAYQNVKGKGRAEQDWDILLYFEWMGWQRLFVGQRKFETFVVWQLNGDEVDGYRHQYSADSSLRLSTAEDFRFGMTVVVFGLPQVADFRFGTIDVLN